MSLVSRLLGVALSLGGGLLMGYAQGIDSVAYTIANTIFNLGQANQQWGTFLGNFIGGLFIQIVDANYGSYWEFGVALAAVGFILIARGDKKPRDPLERVPLLSEPLSAQHQG